MGKGRKERRTSLAKPLTVREVTEALAKLPPDLPVYLSVHAESKDAVPHVWMVLNVEQSLGESKFVVIGPAKMAKALNEHGCHAGRDGECNWRDCPQTRDGEPDHSGRYCPIARDYGDE